MAVIRGTDLVDVYSTDVEAPTFGRVLRRVQGVASELLKRLTDDTHATPIDHGGAGRGALLGLSYAAQTVDACLGSSDATTGKNGGSNASTTAVLAWLIYVPPGEFAIAVDVECEGFLPESRDVTVWATNLTTDLHRCRLSNTYSPQPGIFRGVLPVAEDRGWIVFVTFNGTALNYFRERIKSVAIHPARDEERTPPSIDADLVAATRVRSRAPASGEALRFREFDDTEIVDDQAIGGHHVGWIDSNLNTLEQFATGLPAGGTNDYTATEDALSNPTRDRFSAQTRKTFADEPRLRATLLSHCFGGWRANVGTPATVLGGLVAYASPATAGWPGAWAPWLNEVVKTLMASLSSHLPDLPGDLKGQLLFMSPDVLHAGSDFTAYLKVGGGAEQSVTLSAVGTSGLYLADFAAVPFDRDDVNRIDISLARTTGGANHYLSLCAVCIWSDP